jgi:molecular chaperone DnaJ
VPHAARPRRAAPELDRSRRPRRHIEVATPTRLDAEQEELLRKLAALRGEELPEAQVGANQHGLFSKLKDAFNPR